MNMNDYQLATAILETTAAEFGIDAAAIKDHSKRTRRVSRARSIVVFILRRETDMSYPGIGRFLGLHHTGALYANKRVGGDLLCDTLLGDRPLKQVVLDIIAQVNATRRLYERQNEN